MTDNEHRSNALRRGEIIVDSRSAAAMVARLIARAVLETARSAVVREDG